jgi:hypothetical protein
VGFPPSDKKFASASFLAVHDLFGKPVTTFPDHALTADAKAYSILSGSTATAVGRALNTA